MPVIRPVSDLRDKTPEIEEICINEQKPVFITKNGSSHLVVMSHRLLIDFPLSGVIPKNRRLAG
jgi:PHD/YefM family antitoxin component YafN of YafNO toxin-antitoxin module